MYFRVYLCELLELLRILFSRVVRVHTCDVRINRTLFRAADPAGLQVHFLFKFFYQIALLNANKIKTNKFDAT